jgi:DNA-binding transcriptional MocR family regulator
MMQRALDMYINKGYWKEYINNIREIYKARYSFMEKCIREILGSKVEYVSPGGGLHFYLKISDSLDINSMQLYKRAKAHNVLVTPGIIFYKNPGDGSKYFRISFSKTEEAQIKKGIEILSGIISEFQ